jgi:hypothetical protein
VYVRTRRTAGRRHQSGITGIIYESTDRITELQWNIEAIKRDRSSETANVSEKLLYLNQIGWRFLVAISPYTQSSFQSSFCFGLILNTFVFLYTTSYYQYLTTWAFKKIPNKFMHYKDHTIRKSYQNR